ncbi:hypothetical protein ACP70R_022735 [Stipagrostis hirtigluma subsp. patula]
MDATTISRSALALVVALNTIFLASGLHGSPPHVANPAPTVVGSGGPRISRCIPCIQVGLPLVAGRRNDGHGNGTKVYIVFTAEAALDMSESDARLKIETFHHDLLTDALDGSSSSGRERVIYHYTRSLHGFAARLTEQEKNNLAGKDGVLSIHERVVYRPQTTKSWDFLGLPLHEHKSPPFEQDVIIGVIDTGISPDSESFSDDGLAPPPAKWKGRCSAHIKCNNKIIGAWAYDGGLEDGQITPKDDEGHGTHTASTAAGSAVRNASLYGLANGTARGAVPGARLAIYKVCWYDTGCASEDILAAMDDAIADGVDVISAPLSTDSAYEYPDDALAIGAFHAVRRGVVTAVSAGNCGSKLGTVGNVAPWMISTAATTTDRRIVSRVVLGNQKHILGHSINTFPDIAKRSLLVDPGNCTRDPVASIFNSQTVFDATAPVVAGFSSRGPNMITPGILKPDISAPGVSILAAWSPSSSLSTGDDDDRRVPYNIISGTSVACSHVTGAAAYVKSVHPDWSPAAIISSLVTTATPIHSNLPEAEFAYGAGQANPMGAIDPGLVYDASEADYVELLCAQGYNTTQPVAEPRGLATVTGTNTTCSSPPTGSMMVGLNYPSIAVPVINYGVGFAVEIPRTATNVGPADSVYRVKISSAPGITVSVVPDELAFHAERQKLEFKVSVTGSLQAPAVDGGGLGASASIVWSDGERQVRSPIYVFSTQFRSYIEPEKCRCVPDKCDSPPDS